MRQKIYIQKRQNSSIRRGWINLISDTSSVLRMDRFGQTEERSGQLDFRYLQFYIGYEEGLGQSLLRWNQLPLHFCEPSSNKDWGLYTPWSLFIEHVSIVKPLMDCREVLFTQDSISHWRFLLLAVTFSKRRFVSRCCPAVELTTNQEPGGYHESRTFPPWKKTVRIRSTHLTNIMKHTSTWSLIIDTGPILHFQV